MNKINHKLIIALILIVFLVGCMSASPTTTPRAATPGAQTSADATPAEVPLAGAAPAAYWPTSGWHTTTPEEQGMDSAKLADMIDHIQQEKLDVHSLLIVRSGYLVTELYVYPFWSGQIHFVASTTKSVMGTLVGIAIEQGFIKDVQQPLFSLLPDQGVANLDDWKKAMTLEDLLTMTSGLDCHESPAPGEPFMQASSDWVQFMLDLPMAAQPGKTFSYCTGAIELVSAILQQATGMSALEFANQHLFTPLGIGPIPGAQWPSDPQGVTIGGYGLALTPREVAKLGYLFINDGQWDGKTVVPAGWVAESTASHTNLGGDKEYGYLWWTDPQGKWYAALGLAGQHIFVYPAENLVVVFTSDLPINAPDSDLSPLRELLDQYILPAIKSGVPLPADPDSLAHLQAGIQALAQPQPTAPAPLPAIAAEISDKTYTLEPNPFGWESMTFSFQDNAGEFTVTANGQRVAVGLDNVYRTSAPADSRFPEEMRGHWENQDTLIVEDLLPAQMQKFAFRIQFSGDTIDINAKEKYTGGQFEVQGTQSSLGE